MSLPNDMLAARCLQYNASPPLSLVRVPVPSPGPGEILVKLTAASLCHTDVGMCGGLKVNEGNTVPQTAGHEPCGIIVKLGEGVSGFGVGDRVGFVNHAGSCGSCEECENGQNTYCLKRNTKLRGVNTDGCFSEYAIGDAVYTFKLPEKLSDEKAAPLMCAGVTAYASVKSLKLSPGQWLGVIGCGGVGHLAIQFAKAEGIKVVGLDVRDTSLALASKVGADVTINTTSSSSIDQVRKATDQGVHGAIVLADSQRAMELAAEVTKKHGTVCLVAAPPDPWNISALYLIHKDLKFTGSLLATPQQCRDMLKLVEKNDIHIETTTYRFDQINDMIAETLAGKTDGRLVVKF